MPNPLNSMPQSVPVSDGNTALFANSWWLWLDNLRAWAVWFLDSINTLTAQLRLAIVVQDQTLTVASTTIDAPVNGTRYLAVVLRQDGTGGRAVVWGSGFSGTSTAIDTTASTMSTFQFVLSGGKYVMVGQPSTGMTP